MATKNQDGWRGWCAENLLDTVAGLAVQCRPGEELADALTEAAAEYGVGRKDALTEAEAELTAWKEKLAGAESALAKWAEVGQMAGAIGRGRLGTLTEAAEELSGWRAMLGATLAELAKVREAEP